MLDDLSFKEVCGFLKKNDPKLFNAVDAILGPAIVLGGLAGVAVGAPELLPLAAGLLAPTRALTESARKALDRVVKSKDTPLERYDRMQVAHCLLVYTAFFDALDTITPRLRKRLKLKPEDKLLILRSSLSDQGALPNTKAARADLETAATVLDVEIPLPHPAENQSSLEDRLAKIYQDLARGCLRLLESLAHWESATADDQAEMISTVNGLPATASRNYRAQYVELARQFPEFYMWANLKLTSEQHQQLSQLSDYWSRYATLVDHQNMRIDCGLREIGKAIESLPSMVSGYQSTITIKELSRKYAAYVEQPIIEEDYPTEAGKLPLRFPRRSDVYVPQAFRLLRATGRERLEDEATWQTASVREDLGPFLLSYLASPYSYRYPLLILGDPGSGKSLLTHVLAARLRQYTPIRVELRAVESDKVSLQIEEQIARDTNGQRVNWPQLNHQLTSAPPVILLDGFDELLQASGKVHTSYLNSVREFQDSERTMLRNPVRAIVTSRVTLIDKTRIPPGATVLRLEPFDATRRKQWTEIWNATNAELFNRSVPTVEPFALPESNRELMELAQQPLLLLMLAIYDSHSNELRNSKGLNRTRLYDNLLRRFVERELAKAPGFEALPTPEQASQVDGALDRLGVVAISMFNRRSLLIRSEELELDLRFFGYERLREVPEGRPLKYAELLLGSFFFVHESRSARKGATATTPDIESAFQFLHNTFGEFLAARFIVERVVAQSNKVSLMRESPVLAEELTRKLSGPDGLDPALVASLIYTPLFSRPVVLEMVREWAAHRVPITISVDAFRTALDIIVASEVRRTIDGAQFPSLMIRPAAASFKALPLLGHLAVFSNNLMLLRTTIPDGSFVFDEIGCLTHEDGTRPWDRLTHLWRSWFSLDGLQGLTAIVSTARSEKTVRLVLRGKFTTLSHSGRLGTVRDVARVLGDSVVAGLAGLAAWDPIFGSAEDLRQVDNEIGVSRIELRSEVLGRRLQGHILSGGSSADAEELYVACYEYVQRHGRESPAKTAVLLRTLSESLRLRESHPAGVRAIREVLGWALDEEQEAGWIVLEYLVQTGALLEPGLIAQVLSQALRRAEVRRSGRRAALFLRLATSLGDWAVAYQLGRAVLEERGLYGEAVAGNVRGRSSRLLKNTFSGFAGTANNGLTDHVFAKHSDYQQPARLGSLEEVACEATMALCRGAAALPVEEGAEVLGRLWLEYVRPEMLVRVPTALSCEAISVLSSVTSVELSHRWIVEVFEWFGASGVDPFGPFGRGIGLTGNVSIAIGALASELGMDEARELADAVVRTHPDDVMSGIGWSDGQTRSGRRWKFGGFGGIEQLMRVVRKARDYSQAKRWFGDFLDSVIEVPADRGGVRRIGFDHLPLSVLAEVGESIRAFGGPDVIQRVQREEWWAAAKRLERATREFCAMVEFGEKRKSSEL